tara:strand:+ start:5030 stop:5239 length:210 start_codon:yes stop_codon:yes gene_type:complete
MLRQQLNSDINFNASDITSNKHDERKLEYSITPSMIDPSKSTPPDKFINLLSYRINNYYSSSFEKKDKK